MLKKNVESVLRQIAASDRVLDIGGWAKPFNRANYVIDIMPYETRGYFGSDGPATECFSRDTWIRHDISSKEPLPFGDKAIDYVVCSHALEDIRDPIHVCAEIIRVGKKGYIEVPSRTMESIMGLRGKHFAGYYHHRWLIEINGSEITFRFKPHLLHNSWKLHFPRSYLRKLSEEDQVSYLFWENTFQYEELIQISHLKVAHELEEFVRRKRVYPSLFYSIDSLVEKFLGRKDDLSAHESFWLNTPEIHSK